VCGKKLPDSGGVYLPAFWATIVIPAFWATHRYQISKKKQSSSMQNLLRITFIPLEIGNTITIVFQIWPFEQG
jgi:hypothetical protein